MHHSSHAPIESASLLVPQKYRWTISINAGPPRKLVHTHPCLLITLESSYLLLNKSSVIHVINTSRWHHAARYIRFLWYTVSPVNNGQQLIEFQHREDGALSTPRLYAVVGPMLTVCHHISLYVCAAHKLFPTFQFPPHKDYMPCSFTYPAPRQSCHLSTRC